MQQNSYEKSTGLHWFISPVVSAGGSTGFRTVVRLTTIAGIRSQGGCVPQGVRKREKDREKEGRERGRGGSENLQRYAPNDLLLPSRLHLKIKKIMLKKILEFILCGLTLCLEFTEQLAGIISLLHHMGPGGQS